MTVDNSDMSEALIKDPKDLTRKLLSAMSIVRVINVDDDHNQEATESLETVIAAIRASTIDQVLVARTILPEEQYGDADKLESDEIIQVLTECWNNLDGERKKELTLAATRGEEAHEGTIEHQSVFILDNNNSLMALHQLIGDDVEFRKMSFAQWRAEGNTLLSDSKPTLVLFDRSFELEGQSATAGEELVKSILMRNDLRHVYTGLLTYTATSEFSESEIAERIYSEIGGAGRNVIVIAKHRLSSASEFPEALRMVLYADELEAFRAHAVQSLSAANEEAVNFLKTVKPYALMATFESARREGGYETDNVIRMINASARRSLEKSLRHPQFIEGTLSKLRNAAGVELYLDGKEKPSELPLITWQERFDSKEHLAELSMPLGVGDIFRVFDLNAQGSDRFYILLAQQCDLSVRSDGKRSNDLQTFVLTLIKPAVIDDRTGKYCQLKANQQDIGFLDKGTSIPWVVNFSQQIQAPALALDSCVMNSSGLSIFGRNTQKPYSLSSAWSARFDRMRGEATRLLSKYSTLEQSIVEVQGKKRDADNAKKIIAAFTAGVGTVHSAGITAKIDINAGTIAYGVERFARVTDTTANGLLALLAYHQARPAFDNELFYDSAQTC